MHCRAARINNHPSLASPWRVVLVGLLSTVQRRPRGGALFVRAEGGGPAAITAPSPSSASAVGVGRRRAQATGTVSGHAFFDSHSDGTYDDALDFGINDVDVQLRSCDDDGIVSTTTTDLAGYYVFDNLAGGEYYVSVPSLPRWYAFSDVWNGETDEAGALMHSAVDPETGRTPCFNLEEKGEGGEEKSLGGQDKAVHLGMRLDIPTVDVPISSPEGSAAVVENPTSGASTNKEPAELELRAPPVSPQPTTPAPSDAPVAAPSDGEVFLSVSATSGDVASASTAESAPPGRKGEMYGPTLTERLVMRIQGIDRLEDEGVWCAATSEYIMGHFNLNDDPGAFDVTVSVEVTGQSSSNKSSPKRHRSSHQTPWLRAKDLEYVEVTYSQTSYYRTSHPETYDRVYVATAPFSSREELDAYVKTLRGLSPHYGGVSSVKMVGVGPPLPENNPETPTEEIADSNGVQEPSPSAPSAKSGTSGGSVEGNEGGGLGSEAYILLGFGAVILLGLLFNGSLLLQEEWGRRQRTKRREGSTKRDQHMRAWVME